MKKTFLSFVIASAFVFGFTACGGAEGGEEETSEAAADTTAEVMEADTTTEVMEADTTEVMEADTTAEVMEADTTMEEEEM